MRKEIRIKNYQTMVLIISPKGIIIKAANVKNIVM